MKTFLRLGLPLLTALIALGLAQSVTAAGGWDILGQHTVQPGETVYCIARAYGVDPWAIGLQNDLANANRIRPGQVLSIPDVPATLPRGPVCVPQIGTPAILTPRTGAECACRVTYVVRWGDTLSWIALHYGTDISSIVVCNYIPNVNAIQAGQSLCLP
jgi:peptidoglycan-N-acetylglucosamine deacetylase